MPVTIRNLTSSPLFIPLNSGPNLRLSPGASSADVNDLELKDNVKIGKLLSQRSIALETRAAGAPPDASEAANPEKPAAPDAAAASRRSKPTV